MTLPVARASAAMLAERLIKRHEGLRLTAYDDATGEPLRPGMTLKGHPTIGYGRALDVRGIDAAEAEILLAVDLTKATAVAKEFAGDAWQRMGEVRRAVLIDMAHNLGRGGLYWFARFRIALQDGDFVGAADEMRNSKWARQVGARAERLAEMMRTGTELDGDST